MKVALWAEIRRLAEIEKLSGRVIARRLHCSRHTVAAALTLEQPPAQEAAPRGSLLTPYVEQIKELLAKYPDLSAVRIREEIARGPQGYQGSACTLRRYLRPGSAGTRPRLPGGALSTGPGHAGRLGRMRPRAGRLDHAQGLGVRGRALLQPLAVHRVHPVAAQGRVLPRPGQRPDLLRRQSAQPDLRQPQGGRAQRLGPPAPVSIPSSWRCAAISACSRSPAPGATRNRKGLSKEACATSSTTPWPAGPRN